MRTLLLLICSSLIISCTEISFREPQPKGIKKLSSFPLSLQGKYIITEDSVASPDTLEITKQWYRVSGSSEKDWLNKGFLSDSLVLKKYKGYYFLNFYIEKQWVIRPFKQEKNGSILLYEINLTNEHSLETVKKTFKHEIIKVESNTYYQVDPQPKQLLDFILKNYKPQPPLVKLK